MADLFRRVGKLKLGYDPNAVDWFFERAERVYEGTSAEDVTAVDIREATFELVHGGYATTSVDAALDRLDAAFTAQERSRYIQQYGEDAWYDQVAERATTLYERLTRPDGMKFSPAKGSERAYDKDDVDAFCKRLVDYFNNGAPLTAHDVNRVAFTVRKGVRGYGQGPVDAFLDRAAEVLLAAG